MSTKNYVLTHRIPRHAFPAVLTSDILFCTLRNVQCYFISWFDLAASSVGTIHGEFSTRVGVLGVVLQSALLLTAIVSALNVQLVNDVIEDDIHIQCSGAWKNLFT